MSLQHVLLPGPALGYAEGQITSMATRTGQQEEVVASLDQAAMYWNEHFPTSRRGGILEPD